MKQTKLNGYQPAYPKKVLRGAVLTTAAIMALGTATGCAKILPLQTEGVVPIADPTPEELVLDGEVAIDDGAGLTTPDPGEDLATPAPGDEELILDGDVAIDDGAQP